MNPQGKTALVTGGAHRVGKAITLALARAGANVVINYHTSGDAAKTTAAEVQRLGVEARLTQADVSDPDQVQAMVAAARKSFGSVDILVNSASHFAQDPFPTTDFSVWHSVIDVLVHGPYYCANAVAPLMLEQGEGVIVNIVDLSAWDPWPDRGAHSVSKAALLALTRQLALELAPKVRANAVAPGPVMPSPHFDQAQIDRLARKNLLNRWGGGEEVAKAVMYLVDADFVTGEVIAVDGGERFGHLRYRFRDEE